MSVKNSDKDHIFCQEVANIDQLLTQPSSFERHSHYSFPNSTQRTSRNLSRVLETSLHKIITLPAILQWQSESESNFDKWTQKNNEIWLGPHFPGKQYSRVISHHLSYFVAYYALEDIIPNCAIHQDFQGIQDGRPGTHETIGITKISYPKWRNSWPLSNACILRVPKVKNRYNW